MWCLNITCLMLFSWIFGIILYIVFFWNVFGLLRCLFLDSFVGFIQIEQKTSRNQVPTAFLLDSLANSSFSGWKFTGIPSSSGLSARSDHSTACSLVDRGTLSPRQRSRARRATLHRGRPWGNEAKLFFWGRFSKWKKRYKRLGLNWFF